MLRVCFVVSFFLLIVQFGNIQVIDFKVDKIMKNLMLLKGKTLFFSFIAIFLMTTAALAEDSIIKIGVLANRGPELCLAKWSLTGEYLSHKISGKKFIMVPLDFDQVSNAVKNGEIDFVLPNSPFYVELEVLYNVNRIATVKNKVFNKSYTEYASVVFTKKERDDIRRYKDLKGKTYVAVHKRSMGGWMMAWREFKKVGIDPFKDFAKVDFAQTHDAVVYAVRDGKADAGNVRTDLLERMQAEGKIQVSEFKVIHEHGGGKHHLPFVHSTRAYPERPLAKLKHTSDLLAEKVTIALIEMEPDSRAAKAANIMGWTIPANYQLVHDCLKELKIGPYKNFGKITITDIFKKYWYVLLLISALILLMAISMVIFIKLNKTIRESNKKLFFEMNERNCLFEQVKEKNESLQKAISEVKTLQGILPICANCKKIRDDKGYWSQIEGYIQSHSQAKFSHGMCPECSEKLYGKEDWYIEMKNEEKQKE